MQKPMMTIGMTTKLDTGWTKEDQKIWRERKIPVHTIRFSYITRKKDYDIMCGLTKIPMSPSSAKFIALRFLVSNYEYARRA